MKVTQAMIDAFGETLERVPRREIEEGIQAVLDLIERERPDVEPFTFAGYPDNPVYLHPTCGTVLDVSPDGTTDRDQQVNLGECDCENTVPWRKIYVERVK